MKMKNNDATPTITRRARSSIANMQIPKIFLNSSSKNIKIIEEEENKQEVETVNSTAIISQPKSEKTSISKLKKHRKALTKKLHRHSKRANNYLQEKNRHYLQAINVRRHTTVCCDLFSGNGVQKSSTSDANKFTKHTKTTKNNTTTSSHSKKSNDSSIINSLNSSLTTITQVQSEAPEGACSKFHNRISSIFSNLCNQRSEVIPSNVVFKRRVSNNIQNAIRHKPPLDTRKTAAEILKNTKLKALSSSRSEHEVKVDSEKDSFIENTQFSSLTQITESLEMDSSDQNYASDQKYDNVNQKDATNEEYDDFENNEVEYFEQHPEYLEYEYVDDGMGEEYFDFEQAMQDNKLWNQIKTVLVTFALILAGVSLWFSVNTWKPALQDDEWLQRINEDLNAFLPENSTHEVLDIIIDDRCKYKNSPKNTKRLSSINLMLSFILIYLFQSAKSITREKSVICVAK